MTGQIPSSTQWEQPHGRAPGHDVTDPLEASVAGWCADNGHVHDVIVDRAGHGVDVIIYNDVDIVRVFGAGTRTEALQLAMSWCLDRGTAA